MLLLRSLLLFDDADDDCANEEQSFCPPDEFDLEEPLSDDLDFVECVHVISYSGVHHRARLWTGQRLFGSGGQDNACVT